MPADIVIRIGAAEDRSVDAVFADINKRAQRAFGAVRSESKRAAKEHQQNSGQILFTEKEQARFAIAETRRAAAARIAIERDRFRENSRLNRQLLAEASKTERAMAVQAAKASRERAAAKISEINQVERAEAQHQQRLIRMQISAAKEQNRATRNAAREQARADYRASREIDRFATRTSHRATRFFFPAPEGALGYSKRVAGDLMRGAGVDFSLSGGVQRARERESAAVALSNQGWNPDTTKFQDRISAKELQGIAKSQAARLGVSATDVLAGMTKFTDVTGDLETAKQVIGDIGLLARATGTDLESAAGAAADMAAQLPEDMKGAERQQAMQALLSTAAMQGKRGAVEVKDLARYAPRIVAQASYFAGDPKQNMIQLLATAQIARRFGGADKPATAATAVSAMVNTLQTPARVAHFREQFKRAHAAGLIQNEDIYDKSGQLRAIPDIIKDSIAAASMSKDQVISFKKMWGNVLGAKGPTGLRSIYNKAEAADKGSGLAAIDKEFAKFTGALDVEAQGKMLGEVLETTGAKAELFQAKFDQVTENLAGKLLPTLEQLQPTVLALADAFSKAIAWAAGNPWEAVMVLLGASVARAATESLGRLMLERVIAGGAGMMGGKAAGGVAGAIPGVVPAAGAGTLGGVGAGVAGVAGMALAGAAAFTITTAVLDIANASVNTEEKTRQESSNNVFQEFAKEYSGATTEEGRAAAFKRAETNLQHAEDSRGFLGRMFGDDSIMPTTIAAMKDFAAKSDANKQRKADVLEYQNVTGQSANPSELALIISRELTGVLARGIPVKLTNPGDIKFDMPGADGGAMTPSTGLPVVSQH